MHAEGFTHFDFSIGDGPHKKRFAAEPSPLLDLQACVSWRGRAYARAQQAKSLIRQVPGARRLIRGLNRGSAPAA
jgi:CelD/BcsL family acetyltransferase involved in cellulose biosynthesis